MLSLLPFFAESKRLHGQTLTLYLVTICSWYARYSSANVKPLLARQARNVLREKKNWRNLFASSRSPDRLTSRSSVFLSLSFFLLSALSSCSAATGLTILVLYTLLFYWSSGTYICTGKHDRGARGLQFHCHGLRECTWGYPAICFLLQHVWGWVCKQWIAHL